MEKTGLIYGLIDGLPLIVWVGTVTGHKYSSVSNIAREACRRVRPVSAGKHAIFQRGRPGSGGKIDECKQKYQLTKIAKIFAISTKFSEMQAVLLAPLDSVLFDDRTSYTRLKKLI